MTSPTTQTPYATVLKAPHMVGAALLPPKQTAASPNPKPSAARPMRSAASRADATSVLATTPRSALDNSGNAERGGFYSHTTLPVELTCSAPITTGSGQVFFEGAV